MVLYVALRGQDSPTSDDGLEEWAGTWEEFVVANLPALGAKQLAWIVRRLFSTGSCEINGGAAGDYLLEVRDVG